MSYEFSTWWSPNYSMGYNGKKGITIHHSAGTNFDSIGSTFSNPGRQASAHYGVAAGRVCQYVREDDRAWHAGDTWANANTIGIETLNSTGGPDWLISEETIDTLVELCRDIAERNGMLPLAVGVNLFGHKDFSATMCPGVLYPRLQEIADRVNNWEEDMANSDEILAILKDTSDPTGRNKRLTTHDHVKWIAAAIADTMTEVKKLADSVEAINAKIDSINSKETDV